MTHPPASTRSQALSVALIVPDAKRRHALAALMAGSRPAIVREFGTYHSPNDSHEFPELDCDVVVVDVDGDLDRAIGVIEGICSGNPSIAVMACTGHNDSTLLRRSMQAGAREFLVEPILPETMSEAFARARARLPHQKITLGKTLVFLPAKGGVGVTTVAANFAVALTTESAARVVVVDTDFQLGQIAMGLGMNATFSIADALRNIERLDRDFLSTLLMRHSSGLAVLGSPEEYNFAHLSVHEGASRLFRVLREEFDYVVVDAGTYHGRLQEALFEMADKLYLVTELTLPALRNAHQLISYLSAADDGRRLEMVVNRFDSRHGDIDENTATKALGRPVNWRIPNAYAAALAAQANGVPLAMENSPITKVLVQMARAACGKPAGAAKKTGGWLSAFGPKALAEMLET